MAAKVMCSRYGREMEGLEAPPFPGPAGEEIFRSVSARAWREWQSLQTMLINEKRLNVRDADARQYLARQRKLFLGNEEHEMPEGYVPPS